MNDELILFGSGLDQSLPTENQYTWVKEMVSRRVQEAIQEANLDKARELVRDLVNVAKVSGKELAKVLFQFNQNWKVFNTDETFDDWAFTETGLHRHTIERYIRIEALLNADNVPSDVKKELADRNLAELFPVANMIAQGYEPTEDDWEKILQQPDDTSIREVVRDIKGQEPRASALRLSIDGMGSLWAIKDEDRKFIGSLETSDENPIVKQAIERIVRNSGILK